MPSIGKLYASISLNVASWVQGVKNVVGSVPQVSESMLSVGRSSSLAGGKIAGVAKSLSKLSSVAIPAIGALGGVTLAFNRLFDEGERLGILSNRLGMTTEQIGALEYAGSQAGVSADAIESSLSRFSVNLGKIANGSSKASDALRRLGVDGRMLASGGAYAALLSISDATNQINDATHRAVVLQEIFGKSWMSLDPLLQQGSAGLQQMAADAERLGLLMSEDMAAGADAAGDSWTEFIAVMKGFANDVLLPLMPAIKSVAEASTFLLGMVATGFERIRLVVESLGVMITAVISHVFGNSGIVEADAVMRDMLTDIEKRAEKNNLRAQRIASRFMDGESAVPSVSPGNSARLNFDSRTEKDFEDTADNTHETVKVLQDIRAQNSRSPVFVAQF